MISLDGSTLEGGGQLVRLALSLSSICRIPVRIENIRANRSGKKQSGGLKESHLAALNWLAEQCEAKVRGADIGSSVIEFKPKTTTTSRFGVKQHPSEQSKHIIELKNPGSVWLIWQAIWPFIVFGSLNETVEIVLRGGTNVPKSMSSEYVQQVFHPVCQKIGLPVVQIEITQRGWAGTAYQLGEVHLRVSPTNTVLPCFTIDERGPITKIAISVVAGHPWTRQHLVERTTLLLRRSMPPGQEIPVEVVVDDDSGSEQRLYVLVVAHTQNGWRLGRDFLGSGRRPRNDAERRQIAEVAVQTVVKDLLSEIQDWTGGPCVDEFLQDQLVVFQALADGRSFVDAGLEKTKGQKKAPQRRRASLHTKTVRWVCEQMMEESGVEFDDMGSCIGSAWNGTHQQQENRDTQEVSDIEDAVNSLNI